MIRSAFHGLIVALICLSGVAQAQHDRPSFCEPIDDALLGGLEAPYARHLAADKIPYCEGLLRVPTALPPAMVVSVKQHQSKVRFAQGKIATLTWCDGAQQLVHVKLRSLRSPLFALDAVHKSAFRWPSDLIAQWQPDWDNVAATASRRATINGHSYNVLIPVRSGIGTSASYSFVIQSAKAVHPKYALLQRLDPPGTPTVFAADFAAGPTSTTSVATISFQDLKVGIYRVTFEDSVQEAGFSTDPIYLFHGSCSPNA